MLDDMAHVGTDAHSFEETPWPAFRAAVLPERRENLDQPLGEARYLVGGQLLVLADVGEDFQHRAIGPNVSSDHHLDALYLDFAHGAALSHQPVIPDLSPI